MNAEAALDLFKSVVMFAVYIISPFLLLMLLVGLVTSLSGGPRVFLSKEEEREYA